MNPSYPNVDKFCTVGMDVDVNDDPRYRTPRKRFSISLDSSTASSRTESTLGLSDDDFSQGCLPLPAHAIESGSNTGSRHNPIGATRDMRTLRGNVRCKLSDEELKQTINTLLAMLEVYPDAPKRPEDLCFVKKIDESTVASESNSHASTIYYQGNSFYKRVAKTKLERDELIRRYFNQKQYKRKEKKLDAPTPSESVLIGDATSASFRQHCVTGTEFNSTEQKQDAFSISEVAMNDDLPPHNMVDNDSSTQTFFSADCPPALLLPSHFSLRSFANEKRIELIEYCRLHSLHNPCDDLAAHNMDALLRCAAAAGDDINDEAMSRYFLDFINVFWQKFTEGSVMDIVHNNDDSEPPSTMPLTDDSMSTHLYHNNSGDIYDDFSLNSEVNQGRNVQDTDVSFVSNDFGRLLWFQERTLSHAELEELLRAAAADGDLEDVKEYLQKNINVNAQDGGGWTPLHLASASGHLEVIHYLLREGKADVDVKENSGFTALHLASGKGHTKVVQCLLREGRANVEVKENSGWTALHLACNKGHSKVVQYLVHDCEADVEVKGNDGWTALHLASAYGHTEVVQFLIAKADVEVKENSGWTALHLASAYGHAEVVQYLVRDGKADLESREDSGCTALQLARAYRRMEVIRYLSAIGGCMNYHRPTSKQVLR